MKAVVDEHSRQPWAGSWARRVIWSTIVLLLLGSGAWVAQAEETGPVTEQNVSRRIVTAKTAQDHAALAAYFRSQVADKAGQVKRHQEMLKSYDNVAGVSKELMRKHCQRLIQSNKQQQKEYTNWARQYEKLAKEAGTASGGSQRSD